MIDRMDHLVLTVADIQASCDFYVDGLGMTRVVFGEARVALAFGCQKINLHPAAGEPILPRAARPTPGSSDLCLIAARPLDAVIAHLARCDIAIEQGPVDRTGATGPIRSIYLRDPDGNLVEISEPLNAAADP